MTDLSVITLIALAIAETLGLDVVGPDDDLYALGADSIAMTSLVARLRADLDADVSLAQVMEHPTPRSLASSIGATSAGGHGGDVTVGAPEPFPLATRQRRVWDAELRRPRDPNQVALMQYAISGSLDPALVRAAAEWAIGRHEILRTVYVERHAELLQYVLPAGAYAAPVTVLMDAGPGDADAVAQETVDRGFDLREELPIRVHLVASGRNAWRLVVAAHNIAFDGWSEHLFTRDLAHAYRDLARGATPAAAPVRHYRDYVAWELDWLSSPAYAAALDASLHTLDGVTDAAWRLRDDDVTDDRVSAALLFSVSPEQVQAARARLSGPGASLSAAVGLAFHRAAASLSTTTDIAVGTVIDGRRDPAFLSTVGSFIRVVAVRPPVPRGDETDLVAFGDALRGAIERSAVPFEHLVEAVGPSVAGRTPVFQATYILQHARVESFMLGSAIARVHEGALELEPALVDLSLDLFPERGGLRAEVGSGTPNLGNAALGAFHATYLAELDHLGRG